MVYPFVYCSVLSTVLILDVVHRNSESEQLHLKISGFELIFSSIGFCLVIVLLDLSHVNKAAHA